MGALVLVSGGLDSGVCLADAVHKFGKEQVIALNMFYGQKHAKEQEFAEKLCEHFDVKLINADLSQCFKFSDCALLEGNAELEHKSYAEQLADKGGSGTVAAYVPFRNGLFLAYATSIAYSENLSEVWYGAHADDAAGSAYPDCSIHFRDAMGAAMFAGTGRKVALKAPLISLNKTEVVNLGLSLKVPFQFTWSCYEGKEEQCGTCATCIDRKKAFSGNHMKDPVGYATDEAEEDL